MSGEEGKGTKKDGESMADEPAALQELGRPIDGQVRRKSIQQQGVRKCAGSTMIANAQSRIASSLIAASGIWATTQEEVAVVDPGESSPNHSQSPTGKL